MLTFLLTYQEAAPLILRIVGGATLAWFGYEKIIGHGTSSGSNSKVFGFTEVLISLFLIVGLLTQISAVVIAIILIIKIAIKIKEEKFLSNGVNYYILLLAITISVLFTGPGYLALDGLF